MNLARVAGVKTHYAELAQYVRFGPADLANLRAFHALGAQHFDRISRDFYERIREHQDAHAVLTRTRSSVFNARS